MSGDIAYLTLILATPIALATAVFDLKTMEIPNWLTGGAAIVFCALVFATLPFEDALWRLAGAALVLVVTFILNAVGMMGGGDAKAAAAFAFLVAPADVSPVLLILSITGLLGLGVITGLRYTPLAAGSWKVWSAQRHFPYGVALGSTLIIYLALIAYFVA